MEEFGGDKNGSDNFSLSKIVLIFLKNIFLYEYCIIKTSFTVLHFLNPFIFVKMGPNSVSTAFHQKKFLYTWLCLAKILSNFLLSLITY